MSEDMKNSDINDDDILNRLRNEASGAFEGEADALKRIRERVSAEAGGGRTAAAGDATGDADSPRRRSRRTAAIAVIAPLTAIAAVLIVALMLPVDSDPSRPAKDRAVKASTVTYKKVPQLPLIGSEQKMHKLLAYMLPEEELLSKRPSSGANGSDAGRRGHRLGTGFGTGMGSTIPHGGYDTTKNSVILDYNPTYNGLEAPVPGWSTLNNAAGRGFSKTNVQVEGVDEADIVKTDGEYIYQIDGSRVRVIAAYPATKLKLLKTIELDFIPKEMYVDSRRLVVIGVPKADDSGFLPSGKRSKDNWWSDGPAAVNWANSDYSEYSSTMIAPISRGASRRTFIQVFDVADKSDIKELRTVQLEGDHVSSRKIDDRLYIVGNSQVQVEAQKGASPDAIKFRGPRYKDSSRGDKPVQIGFDQISHLPGEEPSPNYLTVTGLNVDDPQEELKVTTVLGGGHLIYASPKNLYVARPVWISQGEPQDRTSKSPDSQRTDVYRFTFDNGAAVHSGKGSFPGTLLNQYSMDEYGDHFRVAVTTQSVAPRGWMQQANAVYTMNSDLKVVGKLENLAPEESIYSARFIGDRAYIVTYRQVDPLFIIDLKNPAAPKVLGQLKIPGYSSYLHPYDENHIIGIGMDGDDLGRTRGIKMAMFDITDPAHPKEKFKEIIGDDGTQSPVLDDPKAFLFSRELNLLALPVAAMDRSDRSWTDEDKARGSRQSRFSYQGLYVYRVDEATGFKSKGEITHLPEKGSIKETEYYGHNGEGGKSIIDRGLYIGDSLYTLSRGYIQANDLETLKETSKLRLAKISD